MLRRPETKRAVEFLYDILVANTPGRDYGKRVAERMDVPYPSLARYWQGNAVFPAGLVRSLFAATDYNMRVAEFFLLEGTPFRLEQQDRGAGGADIGRTLMILSQLEGEIGGLYVQATDEESEDGPAIGHGEAKQLSEALRKLARTADELRARINRLHDLS